MRKTIYFLFAMLVLAGCHKEEPKNNHPNLSPGQLKVMTFNIRGTTTEDDAHNNWGMRAGACRDMVIDQQPSLVGIQEAVATEWKYMSGTLAEYGYVGITDEDNFEIMAEKAVKNAAGWYVPLTKEEVVRIYQAAK